MWNIQKIVKKGDYDYAKVENHPKATKNGYVLLHRVMMENYLGRLLKDDEEVHHKNKDRHDNSIENLELLKALDHRKLHSSERCRKYATIKCPICLQEKEIPENQLAEHKGYKHNFCSRNCRIKFLKIKDRLTDIQKNALEHNVVRIYVK